MLGCIDCGAVVFDIRQHVDFHQGRQRQTDHPTIKTIMRFDTLQV